MPKVKKFHIIVDKLKMLKHKYSITLFNTNFTLRNYRLKDNWEKLKILILCSSNFSTTLVSTKLVSEFLGFLIYKHFCADVYLICVNKFSRDLE